MTSAFPLDPTYEFSADHTLPVIPGDYKDLADASQPPTTEKPRCPAQPPVPGDAGSTEESPS